MIPKFYNVPFHVIGIPWNKQPSYCCFSLTDNLCNDSLCNNILGVFK